jgi:hypothetical protein
MMGDDKKFLEDEAKLVNMLTREQILEVQDIQTRVVEVEEWGGSVKVQGMTGVERDAFEESLMRGKGQKTTLNMQNIRAKLVAHSVVNGNGERIFTDRDAIALGKKSAAALDRVFAVAQELSGITNKDVEELAENLADGQRDGFGID